MHASKRILLPIIAAASAILLLFLGWTLAFRPAKVALVNFQPYQIAKIVKSNTNPKVVYTPISVDEIDDIESCDAALVFGMGIRLNPLSREKLTKYIADGHPLHTVSATDPDNNISSLDSLHSATLSAYISAGGTDNYRNMANYIRGELLEKSLFVDDYSAPLPADNNLLFRLDADLSFASLDSYEQWYDSVCPELKGRPRVAILTSMLGGSGEPTDSLITQLERRGLRTYSINSMSRRKSLLDSIRPAVVLNFPHGRLLMAQGDSSAALLNRLDAPMLTPLQLNQTYDEYMRDPHGMIGGFMAQSIIMPELDGATFPIALVAQYVDDEGLYSFRCIPEKLEQLTDAVANIIRLRTIPNSEKKVAIYYYKGPGTASLSAAGLDVSPSLYNLLTKLKAEGYNVEGLPKDADALDKLIQQEGAIFAHYADGNRERFEKTGCQALVSADTFARWLDIALCSNRSMLDTLSAKYGAPSDQRITRIRLGNVVLLPQPTQGTGENSFAAVHGANAVPPYHYLASYLWTRFGFQADALVHFGTHGSLEFIKGKQVALSHEDWTDRLVVSLPHSYIYTIADVGEAVIAKRRAYATILSHLTPSFKESAMEGKVSALRSAIKAGKSDDVKRIVKEMNLDRDLKIDLSKEMDRETLEQIADYAEELCRERITSGLYTLGVPYRNERIESSVRIMATDRLVYALAALDKAKGRITQKQAESQQYLTQHYRTPSEHAIGEMLSANDADTDKAAMRILSRLGVGESDIRRADSIKEVLTPKREKMMAMMMAMASDGKGKAKGGHPGGMPKGGEMPDFVKKMIAERKAKEQAAERQEQSKLAASAVSAPKKEERALMNAVYEVKDAVENARRYRELLRESPQRELDAVAKSLGGHYIDPSSGGDFLSNAYSLPTGRNLYAVNTEATPSADAWEKGAKMAEDMMARYRAEHGDSLPRKVAFTLWSGAYIESEGATLAEILYLLGVEPVRDQFGRVIDVRLMEGLSRPRIDVVVQTSGQFRDVAASRLFLLNKAIEMAANAEDSGVENYVAQGKKASERQLLDKGFSPREASELSTARIFGGLNGMAGTGIQGMAMSSDRWETDSEVAEVYMNNMSATYGSERSWGESRGAEVMRSALIHTDAIVQPRQSNTWGALSLDHIYEFMGGLNVSVRNVTGKDADNYFNDLRNRSNARVQTLEQAIGTESRTTVFNEAYLSEHIREGGASSVGTIAETIENIYGWQVMKPSAIGDAMWNEIHSVYVRDSLGLGVKEWMERESPAGLQEITAVMMESARKGYWKASEEQLKELATLHAGLVERHGACCNQFTCNNGKLREFVGERTVSASYKKEIEKALNKESMGDGKSMVMEREVVSTPKEKDSGERPHPMRMALILTGLVICAMLIIKYRKRR